MRGPPESGRMELERGRGILPQITEIKDLK